MVKNLAASLGLIALLVATVVGMLAVLGVTGGSASQKGPQFVQTNKQVKEVALDETVEAGGVSWTLHEARLTNLLRGYAYPPTTQTGAFVQLSFTAENTSDLPVTLNEESVALLRDGLEDVADSDVNAQFVNPDLNILFNEKGLIHPGESKEGKVNFDLQVPFEIEDIEEVSTLKVKLNDTDPTVDRAKEVDLEF
jgi:hypothetical protein